MQLEISVGISPDRDALHVTSEASTIPRPTVPTPLAFRGGRFRKSVVLPTSDRRRAWRYRTSSSLLC